MMVFGISSSLNFREGQHCLARGDIDRAHERFKSSIQSRPRWGQVRLWLAFVHSALGELSEARQELENAEKFGVRSEVVKLWLGRILIDHGLFAEAQETLTQAAENGPQNLFLPAYITLASFADSSDPQWLEDIGWKLPIGQSDLSARWLVLIEERFPGGPGTDCPQDPPEPKSPFKRLSKWRADRLVERASREIEAKRYEKALELLDQAEELWFGSQRSRELRIQSHEGALQDRIKTLEEKEHEIDLRLDLVEGLLELERFDQAFEYIEPADEMIRSIDENNGFWRAGEALLRGRVFLALARPKEALEPLELACTLWPTEVEPTYYLAIAFLKCNERFEAFRWFGEACHRDPDIAQIRLDEYKAATTG